MDLTAYPEANKTRGEDKKRGMRNEMEGDGKCGLGKVTGS